MIIFAEEALADLERIFDFNFSRDPAAAFEHIEAIRGAVLILDAHPEIGRLCEPGTQLRELIISHGKTGYVALYEYSPLTKLIRIAAIRHQRESGYRGG